MKARAHVFVSGEVQGVCFRMYTYDLAQESGVSGWVRNLPDGRVEAVFEGERDKVEGMVSFCRYGPPGAEVKGVRVKWEEFTGEFADFEVRRRWPV